uniref:Uncharacterized protein n=1 Tax=Cacopsylla melanoneura TaxID=428564 RepID=A0A8D9F6L8_9HEMI
MFNMLSLRATFRKVAVCTLYTRHTHHHEGISVHFFHCNVSNVTVQCSLFTVIFSTWHNQFISHKQKDDTFGCPLLCESDSFIKKKMYFLGVSTLSAFLISYEIYS